MVKIGKTMLSEYSGEWDLKYLIYCYSAYNFSFYGRECLADLDAKLELTSLL